MRSLCEREGTVRLWRVEKKQGGWLQGQSSNGESAKEVKKREDKTGRRDEDVEVLFGRDVDGWGYRRGSTSQISGTFLQNVCVVSDSDESYSRNVHDLTFINHLFHMLVCLCFQGRAVHFRKQQRLKTPKGFCTTAQCKSSICPWYELLINTIQEQSTGGHKRH